MSHIKYYYNTKTCRYERVKPNPRKTFLSILGVFTLILSISYGLVVFNIFPDPYEIIYRQDQERLISNISLLDDELANLYEDLYVLEHRDATMYRPILEADSLPKSFRAQGIGGALRYQDLRNSSLDQKKIDLITQQISKIDVLRRKMYAQTKSYDGIISLAKEKATILASIPAVNPCNEYKRLASGFGIRTHPISGLRKFHTGLDFAANIGTPIYATGDGKIEKVVSSRHGYGKQIMINHGFGYKTRYAHMSKFVVKSGQTVKRGELIGYVGNTGSSTGPHLHYEVLKNGRHINPINFIFKDISPEEYQQMLEQASKENESMS